MGLGLSRSFLGAGDQVIAAARNPDASPALLELSKTHSSPDLRIVPLDVTSDESVSLAVNQIAEQFDSIDTLINNAGVYPEGGDEKFEDVDLSLFDQAMAVNFLGTIRVTKSSLPLLRRGNSPRILNISSGAATITAKSDARRYCYGPSKTALNMFTRTLAYELKREGIIVAAMSPGWVRTDMGGSDADLSIEESAAAIRETLNNLSEEQAGLFLDRFGNPDAYDW